MKIEFVENNKKQILEASEEAVEKALEIIGLQCENYARNNAPEDTGLLRNSITSAVGGKGTSITTYSANNPKPNRQNKGAYSGTADKEEQPYVVIGSNVEYAPYQELSTSKMKAANNGRGFLRPAITDHIDEFSRILKNELENG